MSEEEFLKMIRDSNELSNKLKLHVNLSTDFNQFPFGDNCRTSLLVKKNDDIIFLGYIDRKIGLEDEEVFKQHKRKLIKECLMHIMLKVNV